MKKAIVLLNVGTPEAPTPQKLGEYLREFLMDKWVLQMPTWMRALLVYGLIVPRRKYSSAEKYRRIWTEGGSPLLLHSEKFRDRMQELAGEAIPVLLAMRYGEPSVEGVMEQLKDLGADEVAVVPLFPQYAEATVRSSQEHWESLWKRYSMKGRYFVQPPFYDRDFFIQPLLRTAQRVLDQNEFDHVILSFHGLPESHIRRTEPEPGHCLKMPKECCLSPQALKTCYRAQCYATSLRLVEGLNLSHWSMTFQSRLGRGKWLSPSTEGRLLALARAGAKKVAVLSPSFVADGLETLEEIGLDLQDKFVRAGGERLVLVPCLNDDVTFAEGLLSALTWSDKDDEAALTRS